MDRSTLAHPPEEIPGIEYRSAVVTFIDILGFRSFVSKTPANEVAAAIGRLQDATAPSQPSKNSKKTPIQPPQVHGFSDCVVRVRPVEEGGDFGPTLIAELADLAAIQASLARGGVFVRGGVTWNEIYSADTLVFGPALIRAYELEDKWAGVPRVVIDPETIKDFRARNVSKYQMGKEIAALRKSARQAEDGLWYLDYLSAAANGFDDDDLAKQMFKEHRAELIKAANPVDLKSSVLPKYLWAAKYHNASCIRVFGKATIPGVTIGKTEMPNFERLRRPIITPPKT